MSVAMHCRRCRRLLGHTDGKTFIVGPCSFAKPVTLACVCGQRRVWVPGVAANALALEG